MEKRYIQTFETGESLQEALDNNELGKPYVAYLEDEQRIDWNEKESGGLPSNSFVCNYNAKEYVSSAGTLLKTDGQIFDNNLVLNNTSRLTPHIEDGYITFNTGLFANPCEHFDFNTPEENPFMCSNEHKNITIIYKTKEVDNSKNVLFTNAGRGGNEGAENYKLYTNKFTTFSNKINSSITPPSTSAITYIRVDSDGKLEEKCITTGEISTASSVDYTYSNSKTVSFFTHTRNENSYFKGDFYWLYISLETLTDREIQKVIDYNENL